MKSKKVDNQKILLKIVKTWNIKAEPEYRGFRCANCQKYMHKAWYHWLSMGGFLGPVHFCNKCETGYRSGNIEITNPEAKVDRSKFLKYVPRIKELLIKTANNFPLNEKSKYRVFYCDKCGENHFKMYHVWDKQGSNLVESHYCKKCWKEVNFQE